ncbi:MAG: type IV toxin-antitoxin system AbiEi family antitoxin domain-containing protein [Bacillota bacterium]
MRTIEDLKNTFANNGGIMKTAELNNAGYHSRKIHKLLVSGVISKIKTGVYELANEVVPDEIMLMKLFPFAVIYLESALLHYGYTERIPAAWQIAVDKDIAKGQFTIGYPPVEPFYLDCKYLDLGVTVYEINGVKIRIYDKERTICDVLRYVNKLDREVFNAAVQNYIKESEKNISKLAEYAKILRVTKKVKNYFGVWL